MRYLKYEDPDWLTPEKLAISFIVLKNKKRRLFFNHWCVQAQLTWAHVLANPALPLLLLETPTLLDKMGEAFPHPPSALFLAAIRNAGILAIKADGWHRRAPRKGSKHGRDDGRSSERFLCLICDSYFYEHSIKCKHGGRMTIGTPGLDAHQKIHENAT